MAWVSRGCHQYYYKSKRLPDGRVGKVYCGGGARGEQAAKQDAEVRAARAADRAKADSFKALLEPLDAFTMELDEDVNMLATATLLAGGLHLHKGEWRKRRNGD